MKNSDRSVRNLPVLVRRKNGQIIVEQKLQGVLFSFPAACWPPDSQSAHQRLWVARLTPWWDMELPQWSPTAHRLRESVVRAINKQFQQGAVAPETADTVSRSIVCNDARRDGGEIPIPQDSRERTRRPLLSPREEARP